MVTGFGASVNSLQKASNALLALDEQLYSTIAGPVAPRFDRTMRTLTNAADHSKLSMGMAGVLALAGTRGRQAAIDGLVSVAVTSALANLVLKPIAHRNRPKRDIEHRDDPKISPEEFVRMPTSHSYPSGHTAAAFAFAGAVARTWPKAAPIPFAVAATVGYSRVHTGVHYPGDVLVGAVLGLGVAYGVSRQRN